MMTMTQMAAFGFVFSGWMLGLMTYHWIASIVVHLANKDTAIPTSETERK